MNTINIEISGTSKPWVGKITGTDPKYGFRLEFLDVAKRLSMHAHRFAITEPGLYKVNRPEFGTKLKVSTPSTRIDSGYISVADDGTLTEISEDQAKEILANRPAPENN